MTAVPEITPPSTEVKTLKNPLGLLIQLFGLSIQFWISIFRCIYQIFVPVEDKNLTGQVVLITGAGRGLGRELATEFVRKGCKIACADIQLDLLDETVDLINQISPKSCKGYFCDVGKLESVEELKGKVLADFGRVDILVNNAGIIAGGSILSEGARPVIVEGITRVNFLSHIWMTRAFLPEMIERNSGHIVCIASMSALTGLGNASLYAACKWAVTGFMESVREELRLVNPQNKIELSVACPYFINTSAYYVESWKCRLPELTVPRAAKDIVKGVRQNLTIFSIPRDHYYMATIIKLLPQDIKDKFLDIFYAKVEDVKVEDVKHLPNYKIAAGQMSKTT